MAEPVYPSLENGEKPQEEKRTRIGFEGLEEEQRKVSVEEQNEEIELLPPGESGQAKASRGKGRVVYLCYHSCNTAKKKCVLTLCNALETRSRYIVRNGGA